MKPATTLQNFIMDIPCFDDSADAMLTLADNASQHIDPDLKRRLVTVFSGHGRMSGRWIEASTAGEFTRFPVSTRRQRVFNRSGGAAAAE